MHNVINIRYRKNNYTIRTIQTYSKHVRRHVVTNTRKENIYVLNYVCYTKKTTTKKQYTLVKRQSLDTQSQTDQKKEMLHNIDKKKNLCMQVALLERVGRSVMISLNRQGCITSSRLSEHVFLYVQPTYLHTYLILGARQ